MWMPTHVQLTVQRAKGLLTKGKHGTNDCFVVMSMGKEKYQTSVKEKASPDVQWGEECELTIPKQGNTAEIKLTVLHRSFLGVDEFLGQTTVPLSEFDVYERPRSRWYQLHSKPDKKDTKKRGELEVRVAFTVKAAPVKSAESASSTELASGRSTRGSLLSLPKVSGALGGSLVSLGNKKKSLKKLAASVGHKVAKAGGRRRGSSSRGTSEAGSDVGSDLGWDDGASSNADPGVISEGEEDMFGFDDDQGRRASSRTPELRRNFQQRALPAEETPLSSLSSSVQSGLSDLAHGAATHEPMGEAAVRHEPVVAPSPLAVEAVGEEPPASAGWTGSARSSGRQRPPEPTPPPAASEFKASVAAPVKAPSVTAPPPEIVAPPAEPPATAWTGSARSSGRLRPSEPAVEAPALPVTAPPEMPVSLPGSARSSGRLKPSEPAVTAPVTAPVIAPVVAPFISPVIAPVVAPVKAPVKAPSPPPERPPEIPTPAPEPAAPTGKVSKQKARAPPPPGPAPPPEPAVTVPGRKEEDGARTSPERAPPAQRRPISGGTEERPTAVPPPSAETRQETDMWRSKKEPSPSAGGDSALGSARAVSARLSGRLRPAEPHSEPPAAPSSEPSVSSAESSTRSAGSPSSRRRAEDRQRKPPATSRPETEKNPFDEPENPFDEPDKNPFNEPEKNPFDEPEEKNPFNEPDKNPFDEPEKNPFDEPEKNPFEENGSNPFDEPDEDMDTEMPSLEPGAKPPKEKARKRDKLGKMFRGLKSKKEDSGSDTSEKKHNKTAKGSDETDSSAGGDAPTSAAPAPSLRSVQTWAATGAAMDQGSLPEEEDLSEDRPVSPVRKSSGRAAGLKERFKRREKERTAAPSGRTPPVLRKSGGVQTGSPTEKTRKATLPRSDSVPLLRTSADADWPRVVEGGNDRQSEAAAREAHGPFDGVSRERLVQTVIELQRELQQATDELRRSRAQTSDMEEYLDCLLLRIMETSPQLLQSPTKPGGGTSKYAQRGS